MTHATWTSISSSDTFTPGLQAPFDPTGVSSLRRLSVSESVRPVVGFQDTPKKHISGAEIHETGKYPGLRGWAARWEKIDVKIMSAEKWTDGPTNLKLRLEEGVRKFAVVGVSGEVATDGGEVDGFDEEFWEEFLESADDE